MIPIRDNIRSRRFPVVSVSIIIINVLIFVYELSLSQGQLEALVSQFGIVPRRISGLVYGESTLVQAVVPLFSSMFLHGGLFHVLGNMLYLWIFGDNVEDRLGRGKFIFLYLAAGAAGSLAQIWSNPVAAEPVIGASGAIAGVLGAYFISFPRAKVLTLFPIFFFITFIEIPAFVFLFIWFITQWLSGYATLGIPGNMVAWWAHVGGFVTGAVGMFLLAPRRKKSYINNS
ncbi:MAG: rhomboid family intramembrane serine protease [Firmicutes bacterium HGW-Firmicutes-14]|nr:MAG: rhomboid family intramembrane serine protease [Firmicutes bacterium HGW-Firmicutes-14]